MNQPAPSEITDPRVFARRRSLLTLAAAAPALLAPAGARAQGPASPLAGVRPSSFSTDEKPTPLRHVTGYCNYYEFGSDKADPAEHAGKMRIDPWSVRVEGLVQKPRTFALEDLLKLAPLEERIYRLRCVEGWSMVVPWVGYPLARLLDAVTPLSGAKFVEFTSDVQPDVMPGVAERLIDFPYVEGLRIDEGRHPLALLCMGLYGEVLPRQNGAPVRVIVPWKYGFKSAKSIVRIRLVEKMPVSAWMRASPSEYGFYSNVNPAVDHRRWSQATERRLGELSRRPTLPFNGYADQVAGLYTGMDLRKYF